MKYKDSPLPRLAHRLSEVTPSATLALAQKAKEMSEQGHDVVSLTAGEPDLVPPAHILDAAKASLDRGETKYTAVSGIDELRRAIQSDLCARYPIDYELNEIIVSCGAKQAIYNAILALVQTGDEVVMIAPYWLSYRDIVLLADGKPVVVQTEERDGFLPNIRAIEAAITAHTRVLILNSPSNPTGAAFTRTHFEAIAGVLRKHPQVTILLDEIYRRFVYDKEVDVGFLQVAPDLAERSIVIDGVSKTYAMTGLRIGWAAGPRNVISAMNRIQGQSTSNPSSPAQYAALAALTGDQSWVDDMVRTYSTRRRFVVGRLSAIPNVSCTEPKGAFYAFPNIERLLGRRLPDGTEIKDAFNFTAHLLHEHHLVVVPGKPFGAPNHIRLSFATDMETLGKGLDRLQKAVAELL